jgi:hypothetical protein
MLFVTVPLAVANRGAKSDRVTVTAAMITADFFMIVSPVVE